MKFISRDCLLLDMDSNVELSHIEQSLYGVLGTDFCIIFRTSNNDYLQ